MKMIPDYKKIYQDIIAEKRPEKAASCEIFLKKENLTMLDVIAMNNIIFGTSDEDAAVFNQKHRSYNEQTILHILNFQKENNLNNIQLASKFKLSRNTVAKWKKKFLN
ncbi:hypothetical protein HNP38_000536 [Chryseobacterium defluvii]|uniref:Transposase n=1 Tax=Chryseobacterium defluvii TaxID=160396 RepID=A0A840KBV6_9FLAO|nr:helix-turn-helix domain-containing protein [Chryseobacterium defluvii]MBB4805264.1 hypothetical protein [Chryseobacterium defluvii]